LWTSSRTGKFSLFDLASLRVFLCDLVGRETDVVIREDLRPAFRERIARESVPVI
jgi:predicted nucleotidyltransferase